jgi:hypothetical protein
MSSAASANGRIDCLENIAQIDVPGRVSTGGMELKKAPPDTIVCIISALWVSKTIIDDHQQ